MVIVIIIAVIMNSPKPPMSKNKLIKSAAKPAARSTKTAALGATASIKPADLERVIEQSRSELTESQLSSIRDPFTRQKQLTSRLGSSDLVLSGIIWEEEKPIALINDQLLMEGEAIGDFKVVKIMRDEVILARGAERFILKFVFGLKKDAKE